MSASTRRPSRARCTSWFSSTAGHGAFEDPLERDRLRVVGFEREPNASASARAPRSGSARPRRCRRRRRARGSRAPSTARCRATRPRTHPSRRGSGTCRARSRARASRRSRRPSRRSSRSTIDPTARPSRTCRRSGGRAARRAGRAVRDRSWPESVAQAYRGTVRTHSGRYFEVMTQMPFQSAGGSATRARHRSM